MQESDGRSADDHQRERANRSYELRIDIAPTTEKGWRSLRRALRFSRADDTWLRERVPGAVRAGAETDLVIELARVQQAGHQGRVVRRAESGERS